MSSLAEKLSEIVGAAFVAQGLPVELGLVRVSDRPDLCQFQCNGAMAAAKQSNALFASKDSNNASGVASKVAKKNPREIAQGIADALADEAAFAKVELAGPGFINLDVTDEFLSAHLISNAQDEAFGIAKRGGDQTIVVDYGGPNPAKAMHVGHLRSTIIGDSVKRIIRFAGYKTLGDVHLNDLGMPIGQIISEYEIRNPEWPYFDQEFTGSYPDEPPFTYEDLEQIYPEASQACKDNEERREQARQATFDLQNKRPGYIELWEHLMGLSKADMKKNFDWLGVEFELWNGESSAHDLIEPMIEKVKEKGVAVESDGALVIPVGSEDDNKEIPPLILLKSDGAVMYGTTDLATIIEREKDFSPNKIVYVVDQRQSLHFEQVFRAARKGGLIGEDVELVHAAFGTMNGPDGKPFKSRDGGLPRLDNLIAEAKDKAQIRLDEADLAKNADGVERAEIAHKVAIAAIKFADLQNQRQSDYIFDIDRMTKFEGKTGPYLLYQAVRIKSLLKKAEGQNLDVSETPHFVIEEPDRDLGLLLSELPDHFANALKNYAPHILCDYAFKLAQGFSSFYGNCHILSEENEALRASRLQLCALTYRQLEFVLNVLGIDIPERM